MNIFQLVPRLVTTLSAGLVPALWGSPGVGKSDAVKGLAAQFNLEVIDFRLSQCESTDLNGIPDRADGRLVWLPPAIIPLAHDALPEGRAGWLLFLDEANSAAVDVQKAAYKLILDRAVGQYALHPNVYMCVAGNLASDRAIVNRMPTPLQSRLVHFQLDVDVDAWLVWAEQNGIDDRIMAFMRFSPDSLQAFKPDSPENTYPCPRTWHMASRILAVSKNIDTELLSGVVGQGAALEFTTFTEMFDKLPSLDDIIKSPQRAPMVDEPSITHVLFSLLIKKIDAINANAVVTYASRYAVEYQFYLFQQLRKQRDLASGLKGSPPDPVKHARLRGALQTAAMVEWMQKYAEKML